MHPIKRLISRGKVSDALEELVKLADGDLEDEAIMLQGKLRELERNKRLDKIDFREERVMRSQITSAALELLGMVEEEGRDDDPQPASANGESNARSTNSPPATVSTEEPTRDLIRIVYKNSVHDNYPVIALADLPEVNFTSQQTKILFLAANPEDAGPMKTGYELRLVREELRLGDVRDSFDFLEAEFALTGASLIRALMREPEIIHFSGHSTTSEIIVTQSVNQQHPISANALKTILEDLRGTTQVVILNSCYSAEIAQTISELDMFVIGNRFAVADKAAISFARGFYIGLGNGKDVLGSFRAGRQLVAAEHGDIPQITEVWYGGKRVVFE